MKKIFLLAGLGLFCLSACNQSSTDTQEVAALKKDIAELKQSNADMRLKSQLAGHVWGRSPLDDFFASPEFWENTYDSGAADCARRCQSENKPLREACAAKPENERQQCYTDASNSLAQCVQRCS
jgi:hypothetical protein